MIKPSKRSWLPSFGVPLWNAGKAEMSWLLKRTPSGAWHLFGSRLCWIRMGRRWQVLIQPRKRRRWWSFGNWGPQP